MGRTLVARRIAPLTVLAVLVAVPALGAPGLTETPATPEVTAPAPPPSAPTPPVPDVQETVAQVQQTATQVTQTATETVAGAVQGAASAVPEAPSAAVAPRDTLQSAPPVESEAAPARAAQPRATSRRRQRSASTRKRAATRRATTARRSTRTRSAASRRAARRERARAGRRGASRSRRVATPIVPPRLPSLSAIPSGAPAAPAGATARRAGHDRDKGEGPLSFLPAPPVPDPRTGGLYVLFAMLGMGMAALGVRTIRHERAAHLPMAVRARRQTEWRVHRAVERWENRARRVRYRAARFTGRR